MVKLDWSSYSESYVGSSITTGRPSLARQVEGGDTDKEGYPGPPCWWLGVGLTTPPL
jgi:hypothetical protein